MLESASWLHRRFASETEGGPRRTPQLAREILALLKLQDGNPTVAAEILQRALTVSIEDLPVMIRKAFDLIRTIIPLSKIEQTLIAATQRSWAGELQKHGLRSQEQRPRL